MDNLYKILRQVEEYAAATGVSPETVCRAATSNPRLYARLQRRAEQTKVDIDRLKKHMRENPPSRDKRRNSVGGNDPVTLQGGRT